MNAAELTRSLHTGAGRAEKYLKPLQRAYGDCLLRAQRDAMANLDRFSMSVAAAASWTVPDPNEIYDLLKAQGDMQRSVKGLREEAMRATIAETLVSLGVRFDLKNPLIGDVLESMGTKITQITESQRAEIMRVVNECWQEGIDLPATARTVAARTSIAGVSRAMRIARTEIVGIQNGGSLAAARLSGVAARKVWLTAPGAPYPRHGEYPDLDEQTVPIGDQFSVGGWPMEYPGDPHGPAGEVINCRCSIAYKE